MLTIQQVFISSVWLRRLFLVEFSLKKNFLGFSILNDNYFNHSTIGLELDTPLTLLFGNSFSLFTQGRQRTFLHLHWYFRIFYKRILYSKNKTPSKHYIYKYRLYQNIRKWEQNLHGQLCSTITSIIQHSIFSVPTYTFTLGSLSWPGLSLWKSWTDSSEPPMILS